MGFSFPFLQLYHKAPGLKRAIVIFGRLMYTGRKECLWGGFTRKHRKLNMNLYVLTASYSISGKSASQRESLYKYIIKFVAINII